MCAAEDNKRVVDRYFFDQPALSHQDEWLADTFVIHYSPPTAMDPQTSQERKTEAVAELLKGLAHPIRIKILVLLSQHHQLSVGDIDKQITASQTLISHHLTKMQDKGLLLRERRGKQVYVQLADPLLRDWLTVLLTMTGKLKKA